MIHIGCERKNCPGDIHFPDNHNGICQECHRTFKLYRDGESLSARETITVKTAPRRAVAAIMAALHSVFHH